ncbi:MAG: aminomethyl transferase family protein [Gammaproteobacteria bacterium]|nr:aminomethyl transferase family protein [Gammaproteobacteria bacterium]
MGELRPNALYDRHRALGASFEQPLWNMGVPWLYHTDPNDEHVAVRTRVGLWDVSCLQVIRIKGSDALHVLNTMQAADMSKLEPGQSRLGCLCNEQGALTDDFLVYRDGPDEYRATHGDGDAEAIMAETAKGKNVKIERDDDVHVLSVQGPKALELLGPHTNMDLPALAYFSHKPSTLFGKDVLISRAGYSHERGYEIFCASHDAVDLWDTILREGERFGIMPCSFTCLDLCRVEGGLLFYPFDMPEGDTTPWEVGMDWAVDLNAREFRGKQALRDNHGKERIRQTGIICESDRAVEEGAKLFKEGQEIGVVTTPAYSRFLMQSLALVHIKPEFTAPGTEVEVRGPNVTCAAHVWKPPFYDPLRLRQRGE